MHMNHSHKIIFQQQLMKIRMDNCDCNRCWSFNFNLNININAKFHEHYHHGRSSLPSQCWIFKFYLLVISWLVSHIVYKCICIHNMEVFSMVGCGESIALPVSYIGTRYSFRVNISFCTSSCHAMKMNFWQISDLQL